MAKKFVEDCKGILGGNPFLWMDIPLTFQHRLHADEDFRRKLEKMTSSEKIINPFPEISFHSSKKDNSERKIKLTPICYENFTKFEEEIMRDALEDCDQKIILIDSVKNCDITKIVQWMKKSGINAQDILLNTLTSNPTSEQLKNYLENPSKKYLISDMFNFQGMTSDKVTILLADNANYVSRANLGRKLRNYSDANVVYRYDENIKKFIDCRLRSDDKSVNKKYLRDCNGNASVKLDCWTCRDNARQNGDAYASGMMLLCKSCIFKCHDGHFYFIEKDREEDKGRKCECKQKSKKCLL